MSEQQLFLAEKKNDAESSENSTVEQEPVRYKIARGLGYACTSLLFAIPVMLTVFKKKK